MSAALKSALGGLRRASAAQPVRCSCDCCHAARRRDHMQAACISTATSLVAIIVASLIYSAGKAFL